MQEDLPPKANYNTLEPVKSHQRNQSVQPVPYGNVKSQAVSKPNSI